MNFLLRSGFFVIGAGLLSISASGEPALATDGRAKIMECNTQMRVFVQQRANDAVAAADRCVGSCRGTYGTDDIPPERLQRCEVAYENYRKVAGFSTAETSAAISEAFHVDSLVATFSIRTTRLDQFKLTPPGQSKEAEIAESRCYFKLSDAAQKAYNLKNSPENRQKIMEIRAKNQFAAFKLSDINWVEDGTRTKYECTVEHLEIVGVEKF